MIYRRVFISNLSLLSEHPHVAVQASLFCLLFSFLILYTSAPKDFETKQSFQVRAILSLLQSAKSRLPFIGQPCLKTELQALGVILINGSHSESVGHLLLWHNIRKREKFLDIKKPHGIGSAARVDVGFLRGGFDEVAREIVGLLFSA